MANPSGNYVDEHRLIDDVYSASMRELRRKKREALSALAGKTVRAVIRPNSPQWDHRIQWIKGILMPLSYSDTADDDFGLCFRDIWQGAIGHPGSKGPRDYNLMIDSVESFEEVTQEVAESAASG